MLTIGGVIVGAILIFIGGVWVFLNHENRGLLESETKLMKQDGKFPDEPDYMKNFRVNRSEGELETNRVNKYWAIAVLITGIAIIIITLLARPG